MIVDVHTHTDQNIPDNKKSMFKHVPGYSEEFNEKALQKQEFETYWEAMKSVDKAIIVNCRYPALGLPPSVNDEVAKIASSHEEKLIAYSAVHPDDENPGKEVKRCITELGMKGVKLIPSLQNYPPNDKRYYPIYEAAQELNVPVALHMGTHFLPFSKISNSKPLLLEDVAIDFPDLTIIIAHLGHPWVEDTVMLVRKAPNVYTDISGCVMKDNKRTFSVLYKALVLAYEYGTLNKFLFGSDYPVITPSDCITTLKNINHFTKNTDLPKIPDEELHNIIHENWKKAIVL